MAKISELKRINQVLAALVVILALVLGITLAQQNNWIKTPSKQINAPAERTYTSEAINLPTPRKISSTSVEAALQSRRSKRSYDEESLTLQQVSQLLWSAQGVTTNWGGRTAPSAKSAYPIELSLVAKNVEDLDPGVYHYLPENHQIRQTISEIPEKYNEAAVQQSGQSSPIAIVVSANYQRMTDAFEGEVNDDNVLLEAGHVGQNFYLQVESLRLGMVVVGGFNRNLMQETLQIPSSEQLIYLIPVGNPSETQTPH